MKLTSDEIITLRDTFLFHLLTEPEYHDFVRKELPDYSRQYFVSGDKITLPEVGENCIGIIIDGRYYMPGNKIIADRMINAGFIIGALDLFSINKYVVPEILTKEDGHFIFFTESQVKELFKLYPSTMMMYIQFLTSQIQSLNREHSLVTTSSVDERFFQFIAQNSKKLGNTLVVQLDYSYSALASRLYTSHATLYRLFVRLESEGLLKRESRKLIILKPELIPSTKYL